MDRSTLTIEVVYALAGEQRLLCLSLPAGTTAREAALTSGMHQYFPDLDLQQAPLGIFGKVVARPEERVLQEGERVEIYRPLTAYPKEVRKLRAARAKARAEGNNQV